MIRYVFFDFNGTIINDVDLCLDLLNEILRKQGNKELDIDTYKNVFKFPIKQYYIDAGVDLEKDSFADLAVWFIEKYQPLSMSCGLFAGIVDTFKILKDKGYKLIILSASERNNLIEQCQNYCIDGYFEEILGIDNIHAASKVEIAKKYLKDNNINGDEVLFIGDTLHDLEVSNAMGAKCVLVSCGHQSIDVLSKGNVPILTDVNGLLEIL